jgi:uncharacterized membrane protein YhaH (DUF805 family)
MRFLFSFEGRIDRAPYALWSLGLFLSQHFATLLLLRVGQGVPLDLGGLLLLEDWRFYFIPLRSLVAWPETPTWVLLLGLLWMLIAAWGLAALTFRRAADADMSEWLAAAAMAPFIQVAVIGALCFVPPRPQVAGATVEKEAAAVSGHWAAAAQGAVAGTGVMLLAIATGTLLFGVYGYGIFLLAPFLVGMAAAYVANRKADLGAKGTRGIVMGATALGATALVLGAIEGVFCILLAAPLGFGLAVLGGALGRSIALSVRHHASKLAPAFALLPALFALEAALPAETSFESRQTVEIDAPPQAVWNAILHMGRIEEPLTIPLRFGMAYAVGGRFLGEGVGALRHGEFSTGTAIEQVTEWVPNRKLVLEVLTDVPSMTELSPYEHVYAPHATGYFRTIEMSFELVERGERRTTIVERTSHRLRLDPVLYWLPMARWVVEQNNARVLAHIRKQAEGSVTANR